MIDTGSAVDILFYRTFKAMGYKDEEMTPASYNIHGFNKAITKQKGEIVMRILLGEIETKITLCVLDIESPYNMLLGRPWVHGLNAVTSTLHQCIRFQIPSGIGEIRGDVKAANTCNQIDVRNYEGRGKKQKDRWRKAKEQRKEKNMDEMPGIDPSVACHKLDIKKNAKPFKQRIRKISTDYHPKIEEELQKMLDA
ncbi:uncharacterized protein LOC113340591 [Papaver somniferum]|uniref:uncharacterized protein LOC113340591 n=1 Tax=Papaver somniferum TaxID=3469 RepID=UPI000E6F53F6|nr:uncharacterized protein LOC113340591 [Papaver somniferum]